MDICFERGDSRHNLPLKALRGHEMRSQIGKRAACSGMILLWAAGMVHGEIPGGVPLPDPGTKIESIHGDSRIAYDLASKTYRYQGEYDFTYNIAAVAKSPVYFFADVDVEAISSETDGFAPDRLTGTFEGGVKDFCGMKPLSIYLRHQSPHDIDSSQLRQGSWEAVGARWTQKFSGTEVALSAGPYIRTIVSDYRWDFDAQANRKIGRIGRQAFYLSGDLHHVTESGPRGGYTDFWVQAETPLSEHLRIYLGAGQVHDIDVVYGKTDQPVQLGARFLF